jgi:hypothetical protein
MLLWASLLLGAVALVVATAALFVSMSRAERRARRSLFRTVGLSDETVELLMSRNGDVLTELTLVRTAPATAADREIDEPETQAPSAETPPPHPKPTIRLVHPVTGDARTPGSEPRRQPYSNRQHGL